MNYVQLSTLGLKKYIYLLKFSVMKDSVFSVFKYYALVTVKSPWTHIHIKNEKIGKHCILFIDSELSFALVQLWSG